MLDTVRIRKLDPPDTSEVRPPDRSESFTLPHCTLHHCPLKLPLSFLSCSLLVGSQHLLSRWSTQAALIPGIDSLSTRYQIAVSDREQP